MLQTNQTNKLTYKSTLEAYRRLLTANPEKALDTGTEVIILHGDSLFWSPKCRDGSIDWNLDSFFDLDESAFDDVKGCWDGDTPESTQASIDSPVFIDVPASEE